MRMAASMAAIRMKVARRLYSQTLAEEGAQQADGAIGQQLQRDCRRAKDEHLLQQGRR